MRLMYNLTQQMYILLPIITKLNISVVQCKTDNSSALAMELPQSCTKSPICSVRLGFTNSGKSLHWLVNAQARDFIANAFKLGSFALTHSGLDKMKLIVKTQFSNIFYLKYMYLTYLIEDFTQMCL